MRPSQLDKFNNFKIFIAGFRVKKGEPSTHTSKPSSRTGLPGAAYYIPKEHEKYDEFMNNYCELVRHRTYLTLTEMPLAYAPLRADFDLKGPLEKEITRHYDEQTLTKIIMFYHEEIRAIVDEDAFEDEMLTCIVLEKPSPRATGNTIKDGFHLHFPRFFCDYKTEMYLKEQIIKKLEKDNVFDSYYTSPPSTIVDLIFKKPWLMYGSMNYKAECVNVPYLYNKKQTLIDPTIKNNWDGWKKINEDDQYGYVFDSNLNEISIHSVFERELAKLDKSLSVKFYLPRLLSIRTDDAKVATPLTEKAQQIIDSVSGNSQKRRRFAPTNNKRDDAEIYADIKVIEEGHIIDMLGTNRADDHDKWMEVGWVIFNITNGKDEGLKMWDTFSQKGVGYKDGQCEDLWGKMQLRGIPLEALLKMAERDSPVAYKNWRVTNIEYAIDNSLQHAKVNELDIMKVVKVMAGDRFKCASAKHDLWFEFKSHRWHMQDDGLAIRNMLIDDVIQEYANFRSRLTSREEGGPGTRRALGDAQIAENEIKLKKVSAVIFRLGEVSFHDKVLKMCKLKMTDCNFLKKIDENRMLLCCENGVLDLELGIFRDGKPDDYCTFSTGLHYMNYDPEDDAVLAGELYLTKVFPNKNIRKYFLDSFSACLRGGNIHKRIFICTGPEGNNAKTVTFNLMESALGEYFGRFPNEVFMVNNGVKAGQARPELARTKGKRVMAVSEVTGYNTFSLDIVKGLSGNDTIYVRTLYKEGGDVRPMFTIWMHCNTDPKMQGGGDKPTWDRLRKIIFESTFVKPQDLDDFPVPETFEEQLEKRRFHAEPEFFDDNVDLPNVLLWMAFENYKVLRGKLDEPREVLLATTAYKDKNNIFLEFQNEKMVEHEDSYVKSSDLLKLFKKWCSDNNINIRDRKDADIKAGFLKILGEYKPGEPKKGLGKDKVRWYGYRFVVEDEEDEENKDFEG